MFEWYQRFYAAVAPDLTADSAYADFCRRVFGRNFAQHGFADMAQVDLLLHALALRPGERLLDLGCGSGGIADYAASVSGVFAVGIDYVEEAIRQASAMHSRSRAHFAVADMARLCFRPAAFDALVSIDTLYFTPLDETLAALRGLLAPGGRMGILYSHGANPGDPLPAFDRATLPAEYTPLGVALAQQRLHFRTWDLTAADREHALLKKRVLEELQPRFVAEGNQFLFENRYGEANGVLHAIDAAAHARYLFLVTHPEG